MSMIKNQWCSWCAKKTEHNLIVKNILSRNDYQCSTCKNYTVQCRYCESMATLRPGIPDSEEVDGFFASLKTNWASELCSEHDGTIADFEKLTMELDDLSHYKKMLDREKWDLAKGGKIAGGIVLGCTVFGPLTYLAAPGVAAALGTLGLLGASGTGTAISSLSGAALTSASLTAIGPGGMAGGVAFITATGGALGGHKGGVVSNSYFGAIDDFEIIKVKEGTGPALVFINGFLSQKNQDSSDWEDAIKAKYPKNPCYYVTWESSTLVKLGTFFGFGSGKSGALNGLAKNMLRGSKKFASKVSPLGWASTASDVISNPWHLAMTKASMTGILLADLIERTNNRDGFILMGHSLGARVVYYLLEALSTTNTNKIKDVYLLGGAVDRKDTKGWDLAATAVTGSINNFYSSNDSILKFLYQGANLGISNPIGLGEISSSSNNINNIDVSTLINGHNEYKHKFSKILEKYDS